jgi:hypothetical protein
MIGGGLAKHLTAANQQQNHMKTCLIPIDVLNLELATAMPPHF